MIKKIMIGGFWALVLLPNLLFPLVKGSGDSGSAENRTLAEFPVFRQRTLRHILPKWTATSMTMQRSGTVS